jgi:hypothetical protein
MPDADDLNPVAVEALASIILSRCADALSDHEDLMVNAISGLADDTGLVLDVCAAVLLACSTIMGAGAVTAVEVAAASLALDPVGDTLESATDG